MEPAKRVRSPAKAASGPLSTVATGTPTRTAILVAGINYPRGDQAWADPWPYRTYFNYCVKYKTFLFDKALAERVEIFDFLKGESLFFEKDGPPGGQLNFVYGPLRRKNFRYIDQKDVLTVKRPASFKKRYYFTAVDDFSRGMHGDPDADVSKAEYDKWANGTGSGRTEKSMSISDIYERFTRGPGANYCEMHYFGHAFNDGPIMVNTDGDFGKRPKYFDKDPRNEDFTLRPELEHVFGPSHIARSQASFGKDPVVCVWGCVKSKEVGDVLVTLGEKDRRGEAVDGEVAKLRKAIARTYPAQFAKKMGFRVLGALPGMGSVHEGEPNEDPVPYRFHPTAMHVSFRDHEWQMKLYEKHLGVQFANTGAFAGHKKYGRGYVYFDP